MIRFVDSVGFLQRLNGFECDHQRVGLALMGLIGFYCCASLSLSLSLCRGRTVTSQRPTCNAGVSFCVSRHVCAGETDPDRGRTGRTEASKRTNNNSVGPSHWSALTLRADDDETTNPVRHRGRVWLTQKGRRRGSGAERETNNGKRKCATQTSKKSDRQKKSIRQ